MVVDGPLDRPQHSGDLLPLVEEDRLLERPKGQVGFGVKCGRLGGPVEADHRAGQPGGGGGLAGRPWTRDGQRRRSASAWQTPRLEAPAKARGEGRVVALDAGPYVYRS